jgi:hypothetical protein
MLHCPQEVKRRKAKDAEGESAGQQDDEEAEPEEKALGPLFVNAQMSLKHGHTSLIDYIAHKIIYFDLRDDFVAKLYYPNPKASRLVRVSHAHWCECVHSCIHM